MSCCQALKQDRIFHRQLRSALLISWWIVSIMLLAILILPFLLDSSFLIGLYPACSSISHSGEPCVLCGMTRAFYSISSGQWELAISYNAGSLFLYGAFLINSMILIISLSLRIAKKSSPPPTN